VSYLGSSVDIVSEGPQIKRYSPARAPDSFPCGGVPPPASLDQPPNDLPIQLTSFVGRDRELLPGFFGAIAESYLAYNETYSVAEGVPAAVLAPPGAKDDEELPARLGGVAEEYAERLFEILGLMEEKHPLEHHYYLFLLGTRPERQGRGLGSSLMAPMLQTCDRDRMPAYLEAMSERNKQLYLRHGFEVTDEIPLPSGPTMWPMWRSPR